MTIRFATQEDLPRIVAILNQAARAGNATAFQKELQVEERLTWFAKHHSDSYPIYVLELDDKVVAWASLSPYRGGRKALRKLAEISYYVDYAYHRQGIAKRLIEHAIADCERLGFQHLVALLLEINRPSVRLLEQFGFEQWGLLPNVAELKSSICGHLICGKSL